jgi:hypothetical protein
MQLETNRARGRPVLYQTWAGGDCTKTVNLIANAGGAFGRCSLRKCGAENAPVAFGVDLARFLVRNTGSLSALKTDSSKGVEGRRVARVVFELRLRTLHRDHGAGLVCHTHHPSVHAQA